MNHGMNRRDHREVIFKGDPDREMFLETLGQGCRRTGWQVHALCLMPNHFRSGGGNAPGQPGGGREMVAGRVSRV